jgi:hypothetical protein
MYAGVYVTKQAGDWQRQVERSGMDRLMVSLLSVTSTAEGR